MRTREVANWLNFSLVAFALAYRAFFSASTGNWHFSLFGVLGFLLFVVLGYGLYYSRVFAGGDAKLLMALGAVLPFEQWGDFVFVSLSFLVLLFVVGAVYTLLFSVIIAVRQRALFLPRFSSRIRQGMWGFVGIFVFSLFLLFFVSWFSWLLLLTFLFAFLILYLYISAVDSCMIKLYWPRELREGDWLVQDVKLSRGIVKKSIHGLSARDIMRLRKERKRVLIKEGIPFVPAFLLAFSLMVYVVVILGLDLRQELFLFLQQLVFS